jgi:hypothetical protein
LLIVEGVNISRFVLGSLVSVSVLASAFAPRTAVACWDGISAETSKVSISIADEDSWSPEAARRWAKWIARIDAIVPDGQRLAVMHGYVEVCDEDGSACRGIDANWDDLRPFTLFERTARLFDAPRATIAAARRTTTAPLTVQVAASHDLFAAEKLAERINAAELSLHGFLEIGGFPSGNAYAHVVESPSADTLTYHVVVGAFLDRESADAAQEIVERELDLTGFVRTLDDNSITEVGC